MLKKHMKQHMFSHNVIQYSHCMKNVQYCIEKLDFKFLNEEEKEKFDFMKRRIDTISEQMVHIANSSMEKKQHYYSCCEREKTPPTEVKRL